MNHYDILEVSPRASPAVIKAAYRSLMQRHHPDKNESDPASAEKTVALALAYEVLSDAGQRLAYDQQLKITDPAPPIGSVSGSLRRPPEPKRPLSWLARMALGLLLLVAFAVAIRVVKTGALKSDSDSLRQAPAPAASAQPNIALNNPLPGNAAPISADKSVADAIILNGFIENLSVILPNAESKGPGFSRAIYIGGINLKVGVYDGHNIISKLNSKKDLIRDKISEKLKTSKIENLTDLEILVMDVIREVSEASILDRYPGPLSETLGRYGVLGVQFPNTYAMVDIENPK